MSDRTPRWATLLMVLVVVLAAGCSGGSGDDEPAAELTASEILSNASMRLAETGSLRFTLDVQGETFVDDQRTLQLREARGDLVRPDRVRTDFKITVLGGVTVSTSLIIVGDQRWSTNLITGEWGPAPDEFGYDPAILFDNQGGIGPVMDRVEEAERLEEEEIRGREAYVVRAVVAADVIEPLTSGTMTGSPVTVDLWVASDNFDLLRARLTEPPVPDRDSAVWTLDLSAHGAELSIEPPI